jgi:hypothetical protein
VQASRLGEEGLANAGLPDEKNRACIGARRILLALWGPWRSISLLATLKVGESSGFILRRS